MAKEIKYGSEARAALGAGVEEETLFLTNLMVLHSSQTMV